MTWKICLADRFLFKATSITIDRANRLVIDKSQLGMIQ